MVVIGCCIVTSLRLLAPVVDLFSGFAASWAPKRSDAPRGPEEVLEVPLSSCAIAQIMLSLLTSTRRMKMREEVRLTVSDAEHGVRYVGCG